MLKVRHAKVGLYSARDTKKPFTVSRHDTTAAATTTASRLWVGPAACALRHTHKTNQDVFIGRAKHMP